MDKLITIYRKKIVPDLMRELKRDNKLSLPRIKKVTMNVGLNQFRLDQKKIDAIAKTLAMITGQKPSLRRARQAVSSFKLRAGDPVGLALTLRGKRMYDFLERLIRIALPRVRDFRGIPKSSLDGQGNITIGIREQIVFPEIRYEDISDIHGVEVTIVSTAKNNDEAEKFFSAVGVPFAH